MRILVLDDSSERAAIVAGLKLRGHQVFVASSVDDAFRLAHRHRPDGVVLEIFLQRHGEDLVLTLRGICIATRVVVYSAHNNTALTVRAMQSGAVNVLDKPKPIEMVLSALLGIAVPIEAPSARVLRLSVWTRAFILLALERRQGNKTATADDLGMDRRTLQRFLKKAG